MIRTQSSWHLGFLSSADRNTDLKTFAGCAEQSRRPFTAQNCFLLEKYTIKVANQPIKLLANCIFEPFKGVHFSLPRKDCLGQDTKISCHDYCSEAKNNCPRKLTSSSFLSHIWPNSTLSSQSILPEDLLPGCKVSPQNKRPHRVPMTWAPFVFKISRCAKY